MLRGGVGTYAHVYTRTLRMCVQIRKHKAAYSDVVKPLLLTYFEQVQA